VHGLAEGADTGECVMRIALAFFVGVCCTAMAAGAQDGVFPALEKIKKDRPRVLLRPGPSRLAISLGELRGGERGKEFQGILEQLKGRNEASSQAMVWLLTGDKGAVEKGIRRMRDYRLPAKADSFEAWFRLREFGLAYDWLHDAPGFDAATRKQVREAVAPLVKKALAISDDHIFHNYVWMSSGGLALWALATAGEDAEADRVYNVMRGRFNDRLFAALEYQQGLPSEPMGYWSFYVFTPSVLTVLAAQSASETDLVGEIRTAHGGWFDRDLESLIHFTLPDMRFIPWGDLQGGPNGGVTQEMAGTIDAATWGSASGHGKWMGEWLTGKRGVGRYKQDTGVFYMIYGRAIEAHAALKPKMPATSHLGGGLRGGEFSARSGWGDGDTVAGFRCADFFGDHNHYDQGSFLIYRKGLLAVDPPIYNQTRGPQGRTEYHNTLLIGGKGQREARGQAFATLQAYEKNLNQGKRLETGNILWSQDAGEWAGIAGEFAQAYDCPELKSCVRQMLFVRPGTVVIVDRLVAIEGKALPGVDWLLQLPSAPIERGGGLIASNRACWIRCTSLISGGEKPTVAATPMKTQCARYAYPGGAELVLAHVLEVGDGAAPEGVVAVQAKRTGRGVEVGLGGKAYVFEMNGERRIKAEPAK
jgi:hypothetical protein